MHESWQLSRGEKESGQSQVWSPKSWRERCHLQRPAARRRSWVWGGNGEMVSAILESVFSGARQPCADICRQLGHWG